MKIHTLRLGASPFYLKLLFSVLHLRKQLLAVVFAELTGQEPSERLG